MEVARKFKSLASLVGLIAVLAMASEAYAAKSPPSQPVNVNTASVQELTQLPGIGESKAQAIVEYRTKSPFTTKEDLLNVKGIGDKLLAKIADYVSVGASQNPGMAEKAKN